MISSLHAEAALAALAQRFWLCALGVELMRYRVTIKNDWSGESIPQGFPDDAHLSSLPDIA